ncbi:MAG: TrwC relaxase [Pseudonocardiales bacterium]|nr:MAG: TrwC relaxase [Pseudonocardiales bacterium]
MLRIASGHSVDYYLDAVAAGREGYYTGAVIEGEPPGRWYGRGAVALGLSGLVDAQDMTAVYKHFVDPRDAERFKDPERWAEADTLGHTGRAYLTAEQLYARALNAEPHADAERRDELRLAAAKAEQHNVAFLDATFSVPKSWSVLHTAFEFEEANARRVGDLDAAEMWGAHRQAVEDAVWAGNNAMLDYMADKAGYSRVGHHSGGEGRFIDAHDWTIASFFQHDSREHDPHLHIHNTVLNRVQGSDGVWRTLDSLSLKTWRPAGAAVGERTASEHLIRSMSARVAMRPDGKAREIMGIATELLDLSSSRSRAIAPKVAELAAAYEAVNGRAPKGLALARLTREASEKTRPGKTSTGQTREAFVRGVDREFSTKTGAGLAQVAADVVAGAGEPVEAQPWSETAVIQTAIDAAQDKKSGWTEPYLIPELDNALPDYLGGLDGAQVAALFDGTAAKALPQVQSLKAPAPGHDETPAEYRLANGKPADERPGTEQYATREHIHTERLLQDATARKGAPALDTAAAHGFLTALGESGIELGEDQAAAVLGVLTSGNAVESLVGPAGTGKSFVTGVIAQAWTDPTLWDGRHQRAVGLATTEVATRVLQGEGLDARNIAQWLAIQDRLAAGRPQEGDEAWRLSDRDLVMIDESSMVDIPALAAVYQYIGAAGAKTLPTGDHRQLTAIGAAGGMELMVDAGTSYELTEARRFTEEWERAASLRLRAGDETVLAEYHKHGRLIDCGTIEQAEESSATAWLADTLSGKHSLLTVNSNDQAARLSAKLRAEFIKLGTVDEAGGVPVGVQGNYASTNDLVQARKIARDLAGYEGNTSGPINRQQYRVLDTREDGGLVVVPVLGRDPDGNENHGPKLALPGTYVRHHIELGYAATEYSIQGVTVGTDHSLTTPQTSRASFYMSMTRGRDRNTAHMATRTVADTDAPTGAVHDAIHRTPAAMLALSFDRDDPEHSALAIMAASAAEANSVQTTVKKMADFAEHAAVGRTAGWLDQLVDAGHLTTHQRQRMAAEDGAATLSRVLRRAEVAGHDPYQVLSNAITKRSLGDARQLTNVIHDRITTNRALSLDPVGDSATQWIPKVDNPEHQRYLDALSKATDTRRDQLAAQAAEAQPAWATTAFGPLPTDPQERQAWATKAGIVAAHRELSGHDDPTSPLGPPPQPGQVEHYASWFAATRAVGWSAADTEEMRMSNGQLRMRIRAYEREQLWAPHRVVNELAGTRQAATTHRNHATLWTTQATATTDPDTRQRLQQEATDATALADLLNTRVGELAEIDEIYATYLVDTAPTRVNHDRARTELANRHATNPPPDDTTSTIDWLAHQTASQQTEDPHRDIHAEHELADTAESVDELAALDHAPGADAEPYLETAPPDIREIAATEPSRGADDTVRVPTAPESADNLTHARRALAEVQQRRAAEQRYAVDAARAQQMARWHRDDQVAEHHTTAHAVPALALDGTP